jgi:CHAT domain-containing protein/lipopolysaccharide biosynthesis regulator YciM
MRNVLGWIAVAVLCCAASAVAQEAPPDARLQEAQKGYEEAKRLDAAGKYAEAVEQGEHALALREAVLGDTHPEVANCLDLLGKARRHQSDFAHAEPLIQRGLSIREAVLGKNHPDVASSLNNLAVLYLNQGLSDKAEPLFHRALTIQETALGKDHPDVARTLNNLASLYLDQGLYGKAEPLYLRALAIREAALGKNHPVVAESLYNLANLYKAQGLYGQAEPLYLRALAIREAALGKNHPDVATSLDGLAGNYQSQGLYDQAEPLYQRGLASWEEALGKNHPLVAVGLHNLASLYHDEGLYSRAVPLYERALAIQEAVLGKNHLNVATLLRNLANCYGALGEYDRAEPLYERSLAIRQAALGENHPDVAQSLFSLGLLYANQGMYDRAEPLYQRAIATAEAALGKNHPLVASFVYNLAAIYTEQGMYDKAEELFKRSLTIREAALGKNHPDIAQSLNNLALLYRYQGFYSRAEPLFARALAIREAALGKNHPVVAESLNGLAVLYAEQGFYSRAEPLYQRALAIREATFGENHPDVAQSLNGLALLRLSQHRLDAAVPLLTRAFAMTEQRLRHEALGFSEARLAGFLQLLRADEERLYALLRAHPDNASVRRLALSASLLLKGRSLEEEADISRAVYQSLGTPEHDTFERLRGLRTQLASLSHQGPGPRPLAAYQQRLKQLTERGDALEADIARGSAPLRALTELPSPADIAGRVTQALPRDGALVEFLSYEHLPLAKDGLERAGPRYLALVLFPDGTTRAVDLGPAEPIDSAASGLRAALANRDFAFQPKAQALYQLAFRPLLPLLGKARHLFLSPDGQLAQVPFDALHDGRQFLAESFDFTYLTSGRDLLPRAQPAAPASSVVVLADPDFNAPLASPADSADRGWAPLALPGTRKEAEAIQRLVPQAQLFLGAEATKQRLLHLPTPGVLHLATHGFFLGDAPASPGSRKAVLSEALGDAPPALGVQDPQLRSGLLFAGAGRLPDSRSTATQFPPDNALVTALEMAGLDLWGTQLVVLSACDTGRGDVKTGQGVYGLRRAFMVAGAETVVMSLWQVDDQTTGTLMEAYYRNLLAGHGRATALHEAMRTLREALPHPHYWAPFIVLGRDAPLRALAPPSGGGERGE